MRDPDHDAHAGHDHEADAEHDHDAHAGHDHEAHAGHDHDAHAGHDHEADAEHDHDAHAGHDHEAHVGHDHDAHAGHDHGADAEHDHDAHAGHDHDAHAGHDHGADAEHDHDAHAGHDHEAHAGHDHGADAEHDHDAHAGHDHDADAGHDHDAHAGHDHSGHDHSGHDHDHAHDLRGASKKSLIIALCLISTYMFAEVIGGWLSGSLALIADAGHMLTDAAAIAMALVAMWIAEKAASVEHTFGYYRTEVLAALANLFSLWLIAGWIVFEAYHRLFVEEVEVIGWPVFIVGFGGLLINIAAAWVLHKSSEHSVNVEGALQHVIADALGSIAVIVAGAIIIITDELGNPLHIVDPILSAIIALLIVYNTRKLIIRVMKVLLEGVPDHIDVYKLCHDIEEQPGGNHHPRRSRVDHHLGQRGLHRPYPDRSRLPGLRRDST